MHSEVALYLQKLTEMECKQEEEIQENLQLRELCLLLEERGGSGAGVGRRLWLASHVRTGQPGCRDSTASHSGLLVQGLIRDVGDGVEHPHHQPAQLQSGMFVGSSPDSLPGARGGEMELSSPEPPARHRSASLDYPFALPPTCRPRCGSVSVPEHHLMRGLSPEKYGQAMCRRSPDTNPKHHLDPGQVGAGGAPRGTEAAWGVG